MMTMHSSVISVLLFQFHFQPSKLFSFSSDLVNVFQFQLTSLGCKTLYL